MDAIDGAYKTCQPTVQIRQDIWARAQRHGSHNKPAEVVIHNNINHDPQRSNQNMSSIMTTQHTLSYGPVHRMSLCTH